MEVIDKWIEVEEEERGDVSYVRLFFSFSLSLSIYLSLTYIHTHISKIIRGSVKLEVVAV